MSTIDISRSVEARGLAVLVPFLKERAHDGQFVMFSKGPLAKALQECIGDAVINSGPERFWTLEIKVEAHATGNLFLETWSNRNLENRDDHGTHGSNPGWLRKLKADRLLYYFLDTDDLWDIDLYELKRWAFCEGEKNLHRFEEKCQRRYQQANDTWGRLVPVSYLKAELPRGAIRWCRPKQIELFPVSEAS